MKNIIKLIGNLTRARSAKVPLVIIALVAVIGFSFTACGDDDNGGDDDEDSGNIDPLTEQLDSISSDAESDTTYTIEISVDAATVPQTLSYPGKSGITIIMKGAEAERTISLSGTTGALFTVGSGVKLVLDNNITLKGISNNNASLVNVNSGGALEMKAGAKITGNSRNGKDSHGGGVSVFNGGTFAMSGGEISGNSASSNGGGVNVWQNGTFTMNGGKILGNTSSHGAVSVFGSGTFNMSGGEISGNTASNAGGGVVVSENGIFNMDGGKISANTAGGGGGVQVWKGTFAMNGGEISGNTAGEHGGGIIVTSEGATFIMNGGVISGNTAGDEGGGVRIEWGGEFRIVNGTIYGSNEADASLKNTAMNSGMALSLAGDKSSQRGTFSGSTWTKIGDLNNTDDTIKVVNGVLQ